MNSNKKRTDDIYTYLKFRGDLDLKNYPLNEVDVKAASNLPKGQREIIGNLIKMWMTESRKTVVNAIKSEESSWEIPEFNIRKKSEF